MGGGFGGVGVGFFRGGVLLRSVSNWSDCRETSFLAGTITARPQYILLHTQPPTPTEGFYRQDVASERWREGWGWGGRAEDARCCPGDDSS